MKVKNVVILTIDMMIAGLVYAWSAISPDLIKSFGNIPNSKSSLVFTVCMIFFCLGGLIAGKLSSKISRENIITMGILFVSLGLVISAGVKSFNLLFITYSFMCGIGSGFIYNAGLGLVVFIDEKKIGMISGILLMAFGLGGFVMSFLYNALSSKLPTFRQIFIALGIAFGLFRFLSSFFINIKYDVKQNVMKNDHKNKALKSFDFYIYFLWTTVLSGIGIAIIAHADKIISSQVQDDILKYLSVLSGIAALSNGAGRVLHGFLLDKFKLKNMIFLAPIMFITTYGILSLTSKIKVPLFVAIFILILGGASFAGLPPMNSTFMKKVFGKEEYSFNLALVNLNILISSFFPAIFGKFMDIGMNFSNIYLILMSVSVFAFLISIVLSIRINKYINLKGE